jgi:hypothetical protein
VARGCALMCALNTKVFKVKPFRVIDTVHYTTQVNLDITFIFSCNSDSALVIIFYFDHFVLNTTTLIKLY